MTATGTPTPTSAPTPGSPDAVLDDFLCYKAKRSSSAAKFVTIPGVHIDDQLESVIADLKAREYLCTPADKNAEGTLDLATHLMRYKLALAKGQPAHVKRTLHVSNQLGDLSLDTVKPSALLVPAAKSLTSPPSAPDPMQHDVDHYKCYGVKVTKNTAAFPTGVQVTVGDQFTNPPKGFAVKKPARLCLAVDKNDEGVKNAAVHLLCYGVKALKGEPKHVQQIGVFATDQFGPTRVDTVKERELCIPSVVTP